MKKVHESYGLDVSQDFAFEMARNAGTVSLQGGTLQDGSHVVNLGVGYSDCYLTPEDAVMLAEEIRKCAQIVREKRDSA